MRVKHKKKKPNNGDNQTIPFYVDDCDDCISYSSTYQMVK